VVVVGGRFGGLAAAKALRKAPVQVILIDRTNHRLRLPRGAFFFDDWDVRDPFFLKHPFLTMSDLYLVSRKTALVAIDLQNAIMGISAVPYPATQVVQRNRKIADELRARGGLVVWVRVNLKQFIQLPVDESSPLVGKPLPDELSEIVQSAGFQDGDLLVTKRHWGAFAGTSLEAELRSRGIDTVVLTGISTNGGVESTLRQGTGLGLRVRRSRRHLLRPGCRRASLCL
jgi:nicotinamidase-related amidase